MAPIMIAVWCVLTGGMSMSNETKSTNVHDSYVTRASASRCS